MTETTVLEIQKNTKIVKDILVSFNRDLDETFYEILEDGDIPYKLVKLSENKLEEVKGQFFKTMPNYSFFKVKQNYNPYLRAHYELRAETVLKRYGRRTEVFLFHGTDVKNVEGICKENFNWRFSGESVGHRFGRGVSFAPRATYAKHYTHSTPYVMFSTKVMWAKKCVGDPEMTVPPEGYDTSIKPNGDVVVKYDDGEFYPEHIIFYGSDDAVSDLFENLKI